MRIWKYRWAVFYVTVALWFVVLAARAALRDLWGWFAVDLAVIAVYALFATTEVLKIRWRARGWLR